MELLNYSRQLMQQLQTLRKEGQFCDCTVLVGDTIHPAHKVVLAASSLLFKSLLESSDNISIDNAMVSSQEFFSLLDLAYMGRLPPGKHNISRIIAAADNLQMFDVAVGCKNILDDLMKQAQNGFSVSAHPVHDGQSLNEEACSAAVERQEQTQTDPGESLKDAASQEEEGAVGLLCQKREEFIKTLHDIKPWIKALQTWDTFSIQQRHIIVRCFEGDPGVDVVFQRLLDLGKTEPESSAQTFLMLFDHMKKLNSELESAPLGQREQSEPDNDGALREFDRSSKHHITHVPNLTDSLSGVRNISDVQEGTTDIKKTKESTEPDKKTEGCAAASSLLRCFQIRLAELNLDPQVIRQCLEEAPSILPDQREYLQKVLEEAAGVGVMEKLISAALDGGSVQPLSVWRFLLWAATHDPKLFLLLQEIREKPEAHTLLHKVAQVEALLKHKKLILETICDVRDLERAAGGLDPDNDATEFLQSCCGFDGRMEQVLDRVVSRDSQHVGTLWRLLSLSQQSFPQLSVLMDELGNAEREGGSDAQVVVGSEKEKDKEEEDEEEDHTQRRGKGVITSHTCQWCNKTFDYKCRLLKHRMRCVSSPKRVQRCTECSLTFPSPSALQQHMVQDHSELPIKRKKTQPVDCELCGKTFKHPSGLLYHRRTEHLDERPFACEECGAKFAAGSSLKNHKRLHTGERPYRCKHCDMSFAVAAALSYHTKKKHAEGKMFACQYCSAAFAQSIELTRHVRTHTGDKPYVCRECGKGFKQANGLSVHIQSSHNVADPHDCQKCRVSFGSLEKLRDHIQELHPKELHQCPVCNKILSTGAQLGKHMSVHVGSKPYSCKDCNKFYQTLSGLWYHNRTIHQDMVTSEGSRRVSHLLHCKICNKAFSNRNSLFKHQISKHPETCTGAEGADEKEAQSGSRMWRCVNCNCALSSEQELQQHVFGEHVTQQGSVFCCTVCSLSFDSEPEFQQHFLTNHIQLLQEEQLQTHDSTSQMLNQAEEVDGSQQVFVAMSDGGDAGTSSGIVAVNMEDLLAGRVTLICEET